MQGTENRNVRNLVATEIMQARNNYFKTKLEENSSNCRGMWKTVNNILNREAFSTNSNKFTIDGSDTCDRAFIASRLNEYFSNVG